MSSASKCGVIILPPELSESTMLQPSRGATSSEAIVRTR
jgi:hypothetical protein